MRDLETAKANLSGHSVCLCRDGTDVCPMEKAVKDTDAPDEAYNLIYKKLKELARL